MNEAPLSTSTTTVSRRNAAGARKFGTLMSMLLVSSVSSFTMQDISSSQSSTTSGIASGRTSVAKVASNLYPQNELVSSSSTSTSSRLSVATSSPPADVDNTAGMMPELGKNGVYSIQNEDQHKALLEVHKDKLVIMKVFAPWCRACKGLEPKFNALVKDEKYENLPIIWADLTIQHNKDYVKSIGVLALPTVQFYAHGERADTFPCGPSKVPILKKKLAAFVNKNVDADTLQVKPRELRGMPGGAEATDFDATEKPPAVTGEAIAQRNKNKLRAIPYFSDMLESDFDKVLSKASLLTFDEGSIIMREGNPGQTFYYILDGGVEICQRTSYEDPLTTPPMYLGTVINKFEGGDWFGERALILGEPRAASIRAYTTTKCLAFDKDSFPAYCPLSSKTASTDRDSQSEAMEVIDDKYGVALADFSEAENDKIIQESKLANQSRGSPNKPRPINGVDNDIEEDEEADSIPAEVVPVTPVAPSDNARIIVPLLIRFKLIRLVARCFDYIVENKPSLGDPAVRRRREMLVQLLAPSQHVEFTDAYNLIDVDGDGEITLLELRQTMDAIGEGRSDDDLLDVIAQSRQDMDGKEVITYKDFMGLMAESEIYYLFLETFRSLDKRDIGFVRAKDLDRVLCGIRDLITDDQKSIIDVEDTEMMVDYEQFSRMLLGSSLK